MLLQSELSQGSLNLLHGAEHQVTHDVKPEAIYLHSQLCVQHFYNPCCGELLHSKKGDREVSFYPKLLFDYTTGSS